MRSFIYQVTLVTNSSNFNKNDGVFMYVKADLDFKVTNFKLANSKLTISRLFIRIGSNAYNINAMYRPPLSDVNQFLLDLSIFFQEHLQNHTKIFVGYININLRENSNTSSEYIALLSQYGFGSYINNDTNS